MTRAFNRFDGGVLGFAWGTLMTSLLAAYVVPFVLGGRAHESWLLLTVVSMGIFAGHANELDEREVMPRGRHWLIFLGSLALALLAGHTAYTAIWGDAIALHVRAAILGVHELAVTGLLYFAANAAAMIVYRLCVPPVRKGWRVTRP
jgi:hypothetical protein